MTPSWLPALCATSGEWKTVVQNLYTVFERDFVVGRPMLHGCPVWWNRSITNGYEEAFWHLIEREDIDLGERCFDPPRAARIAWCGAIIRNCDDPTVTSWRYREGGGQFRMYLWFEEGDYVVVLEERRRNPMAYFLITAYHVDGESRRRSLRRKFDRREP